MCGNELRVDTFLPLTGRMIDFYRNEMHAAAVLVGKNTKQIPKFCLREETRATIEVCLFWRKWFIKDGAP